VSCSDSRRKKEPVTDRWVPGVKEEKGGEGARLLPGLGRGEEEARGGGNKEAREGVGLGHQATRPRGGSGWICLSFVFFPISPLFSKVFLKRDFKSFWR